MENVEFSEFAETVTKYEKNQWLAELVYIAAIKELENVRHDFTKLKIEQVDEIIKPFLVIWGQMARAIEQVKASGWETLVNNLRDQASSYSYYLAGETLVSINLDEEETSKAIKGLFDAIRQVKHIGPTSTSKILHLLNPELFVMWDDEIRKCYKAAGTAQSYVSYLKHMKGIAQNILKGKTPEQVVKQISGNKTVAKLIDEYVWTKCHPKR